MIDKTVPGHITGIEQRTSRTVVHVQVRAFPLDCELHLVLPQGEDHGFVPGQPVSITLKVEPREEE